MKKNEKCQVLCNLVMLFGFLLITGCAREKKDIDSFSVAFLTDIHIQPEANAVKGFSQALDTVNKLSPEFIITGGDLIMDALDQSFGRADSLYNLYMEVIKKSKSAVYNTLGNHEIYGIYKNSGADTAHEEYGEKMFEKRLGKSYYSFNHKGWKFMIINSVEDTRQGQYVGQVDANQILWIRSELKNTDPTTPIVLSTHIPFIAA